jgi:peptide-methionine (S)-S-oxide reductase
MAQEIATFGGGCFWCLEAVYQEIRGVEKVESGYMGGKRPNPTYEQVCSGATGHVEVVQLTFDNDEVTYRDLLEVFFAIHDPTTPDRQGNDSGTQYRSAIFTHSEEQRATSQQVIEESGSHWPDPIVTTVEPAQPFYRAEDYHQNYYRDNTYKPYCMFVVNPKVKKFRDQFAGLRTGTT